MCWDNHTSRDTGYPLHNGNQPDCDYVRLTVTRWDDTHLYGLLDESQEVCVCYQSDDLQAFDRSYLSGLLYEGAQVNLIRPRVERGTENSENSDNLESLENFENLENTGTLSPTPLLPEYLILDPDYLVDISALSRCVETFGDSPALYLLHKLEPAARSEALLLGNLAGQLLDEELHNLSTNTPYAESAKTFFHQYALALLTTPVGKDFHQQAMRQQANIRKALREDLPKAVSDFRPSETMVEPSFYSEMLGVQGRMDFLQLDHRVLIEQKSGKGAFVPYDPTPDTPKIQQPHYVQLLLYMALLRYNHRATFEANGSTLHAYLMYSRYTNALQREAFSDTMLFRALRLRNRIVAAERRYAQEGFDVLHTLTADDLNERHTETRLWECFQRPHIETMLRPLHEASPLELAYVLRFLQFVAREQVLAKLGHQATDDYGFSGTWRSTLEEKREEGDIWDSLKPHPLPPPPNGRGVDTTHANDSNYLTEVVLYTPLPLGGVAGGEATNFRPGDAVFFYPYPEGTTPDARKAIVFRASIKELHSDRVVLRLRAEQTDERIFQRYDNCLWAIEHDFIESSFNRLHRSVYAFLSAPKERRDLLLLQREPCTTPSRTLRADYGRFNELQQRVKQADELFLIIGPPGTGKTSFGMLHTLQEQLLEPGSRVLILSYTNRAVDEVCSKLVEEDIDFLRMGSDLSCAPEYKPFLWDERTAECQNVDEVRTLLLGCRVVVGTTTTLTSHAALFDLMAFDLAIIDEASQILEPHLLGLLSATHRGKAAIRKFVMIGDHKQLPAVVKQEPDESHVDDPMLNAIGLHDCALSLFERLLTRYADNPAVTYMLTRQGRMHPLIAAFPNEFFYEGRLTHAGLPHQLEKALNDRVVFLPVRKPRRSPSDKVNLAEAKVVANVVARIYEEEKDVFDATRTLGIIVPYRNQITTIRQQLAQLDIPALNNITIDTVERFQGSQRRYIIYSFTVQQPYQLEFLTSRTFEEKGRPIDRKLNVVMTRAQEHLILVGNPTLLSRVPLFRQLIERYLVG